MSLIKPCKSYYQTPFICSLSNLQKLTEPQANLAPTKVFNKRTLAVRCSSSGQGGGDKKPEKRSFLTLEEAGLVEVSGLGTHEKFLCRLTISSLNLLRVISEQEGCPIEELNAGRVCDWFLKDKLKREQDIDTAILQWDDSDFLL